MHIHSVICPMPLLHHTLCGYYVLEVCSAYCFDVLEDMCCAHAVSPQLAARIAVSNLHKNTLKSFSKT